MPEPPYDRLLRNAKALRREMTPWERRLWYTFLKRYPTHIYRQRVIGPYIVDFYCDAAKLAIELDGSQHFEAPGLTHDDARDAYLAERGIAVLRIPNREVDLHIEEVCKWIDREIESRKKQRN